MSFLTPMAASAAETPPPAGDDYWYREVGAVGVEGEMVTPASSMRATAVYRSVDLISRLVAQLPLGMYQSTAGGARERAPDHPLDEVLRRRPNDVQTSFDWRSMMQAHLCLRGNAFSEIVWSGRGTVEKLLPLDPDRVRVVVIGRDRLRYDIMGGSSAAGFGVTQETVQPSRRLSQDQVLHLRGLSLDGWMGLSPIMACRLAVGMSLAGERYGAEFFGNNAQPSGLLSTPQTLNETTVKEIKEAWSKSVGRGGRRQGTAVLGGGTEFKAIGMSNEDAQFLETRGFQVAEIARIFGVPPHLLFHLEKVTSWGTGIEEQTIAFLVYTLQAWLVQWSQAISRDLITEPDRYYAAFSEQALLRATAEKRAQFYKDMFAVGGLSPDDIRRFEDLPPIPDGDTYYVPANMVPVGQRGQTNGAAVSARAEPANGSAVGDPAQQAGDDHVDPGDPDAGRANGAGGDPGGDAGGGAAAGAGANGLNGHSADPGGDLS